METEAPPSHLPPETLQCTDRVACVRRRAKVTPVGHTEPVVKFFMLKGAEGVTERVRGVKTWNSVEGASGRAGGDTKEKKIRATEGRQYFKHGLGW